MQTQMHNWELLLRLWDHFIVVSQITPTNEYIIERLENNIQNVFVDLERARGVLAGHVL